MSTPADTPRTKPARPTSKAKPRAKAKAAASAPEIAADVRATLDDELQALETGSRVWSTLSVAQRATLMERVRAGVISVAEEWARVAAETKLLDATHPLRGEEWLSGPYAVLSALGTYERTLRAIAAGTSPLADVKTSLSPSGQVREHVFPADAVDATLLSGFTGEVWLQPGVTAEQARNEAGLAQLHPQSSGGVGLVLGAGNITSIPVLDVLYELLAHNRVSLLKVNPTQDRLVPIYRRALAALIEPGFLRIVTGGGDVGAYLTGHDAFSHVHITGSATTFDAIVWGTGEAAAERKRDVTPLLNKPITGELGGVAPIIVVPGQWTHADLEYQAEHVVTMRLQNGGHNCIAGQVVVISRDWDQREDFLAALRRLVSEQRSETRGRARELSRRADVRRPDPRGDRGGG